MKKYPIQQINDFHREKFNNFNPFGENKINSLRRNK